MDKPSREAIANETEKLPEFQLSTDLSRPKVSRASVITYSGLDDLILLLRRKLDLVL